MNNRNNPWNGQVYGHSTHGGTPNPWQGQPHQQPSFLHPHRQFFPQQQVGGWGEIQENLSFRSATLTTANDEINLIGLRESTITDLARSRIDVALSLLVNDMGRTNPCVAMQDILRCEVQSSDTFARSDVMKLLSACAEAAFQSLISNAQTTEGGGGHCVAWSKPFATYIADGDAQIQSCLDAMGVPPATHSAVFSVTALVPHQVLGFKEIKSMTLIVSYVESLALRYTGTHQSGSVVRSCTDSITLQWRVLTSSETDSAEPITDATTETRE